MNYLPVGNWGEFIFKISGAWAFCPQILVGVGQSSAPAGETVAPRGIMPMSANLSRTGQKLTLPASFWALTYLIADDSPGTTECHIRA